MSVGSRMKERRESLGMTQNQLAQLLGVTKGAIGNYETDANSPKASILYKVFDVLKCDANYLFQDEIREQRDCNATLYEMEHLVKKYRLLDAHGKKAVSLILDCEYQRCQQESLTDDASEAIPADKVWHKPGLEDVTEGEIIEAGDDTAKLEALYRKRFRLASDMDMEVSRISGEKEKMA